MRLNIRNVIVSLLLLAAAGASWYWRRPQSGVEETARPPEVPRGYYLKNAILLGTDDAGRVIYEVSAARAEEEPDSNALALETVEVQYRPATDVHWLLKADSGAAPADGSLLILQGAVELASRPVEGGASTVIRTNRLQLDPQAYVASSLEAVSVFIGEERLDAVGMKAYLKDDRLELESGIHGNFLP
jgi:lipopolysaccharide export system protein LptC